MEADSRRVQQTDKWLYRRYVDELGAQNQAGAIRFAEALFFLRYGADRKTMPGIWEGFESNLFRMAHSGEDNETAVRTILNIPPNV